ncbi:MAG: folate/biopterin family MFS transporter [Synechococcaceae cyanobacterium SM2_3_1]|nr:folate/biopterin family MFS transporter [Synechococcaceae cyanobacterium SM2_3_1]
MASSTWTRLRAKGAELRTLLSPAMVAILAVYFVQGAIGLARLATSFFFKDQLGLSPAEVAALTGITVLPWTIKPLYGWLSDTLPIAGYRRRSYLVLSGLLGCGAWLAMALWVESPLQATVAVLLASLSTAIGDVIVDSLVVERARTQDWGATGTLQSLCWGSTALGSLITAYLGGVLLESYPPQVLFGLTALLPLASLVAALFIQELPQAGILSGVALPQQLQQIWAAVREPSLYLPVLFIFLWQSTPTAESAFFYFVTNDLGFSPAFLGEIRLATSVASLVGVVVFQSFFRYLSLRPLLGWITVITSGLGMTNLILVYHLNRSWGVDDRWFSLGDSVILTVAGQLAYMPILVLAARLCPPGIEATLFALLMSVINLASFLSHELGGVLMQWLGVTETNFKALGLLVVITNLSTLMPLPFLRWLPAQSGSDPDSGAAPSPPVVVKGEDHYPVEAG